MAEKDEYAMARCLDEHALMISKQVLPFRVYTEFPRVQLNPLLLMAEILKELVQQYTLELHLPTKTFPESRIIIVAGDVWTHRD